MRTPQGQRVAVALSGGADSTAAALLLKQEGYETVGLTMVIPVWRKAPDVSDNPQVEAARAVTRVLGIEHQVVDLSKTFQREVVYPLIEAYASGLTPNPCVSCNRNLKFGALLRSALKWGCSLLATGHYARIVRGEGLRIMKGADRSKDQSYVLWTLDQKTLRSLAFPLGGMYKSEVREIVERAGLSGMVLPESQDICFLSNSSYAALLEELAPKALSEGPIITVDGKVIGRHRGIARYTAGQRKGLGIPGDHAYYVLEIRPWENAVVVGKKEECFQKEFLVRCVNFISEPPSSVFDCTVVTRYRGPEHTANVRLLEEGRALVSYKRKGPLAAPGQSAVFYMNEELLGGGVIEGPPKGTDG